MMNDLTSFSPDFSSDVSMTSVEIARLCHKRHDNVMRVANTLKDRGIILAPQIEEQYTSGKGRVDCRKIYRLNKVESFNLVANLSPEFTARVIDRWQELEEQAGDPMAALHDPVKLRALLIEHADKAVVLQSENDQLKPLATSYEHLSRSDGTLCISDAAKALGLRPKDLFRHLQAERWIYRRAGNSHWIGYVHRVQQGLLDHRVTEVTNGNGDSRITEQVRITAKGMAKLGEKYATLFGVD